METTELKLTIPHGRAANETGGTASRAAEKLSLTILQSMRDAVITINPHGTITTFNREAEKIFGLTAKQVVGHGFAEVFLPHLEYEEFSDIVLDAILNANTIRTDDLSIERDGETRYLNIQTSFLKDAETREKQGIVVVVSDVSDRVRALRERIEFGATFIMTICFLGIASIINVTVFQHVNVDIYSPTFSWLYLSMLILPAIAIILFLRLPLSRFGITLVNWRKSFSEGIIFSIIATLIAITVALIQTYFDPARTLANLIDYDRFQLAMLLYLPHSILQELLARGILQTSVANFFQDEKGWLSIVLASAVFSLFHGHLGLMAILLTFGMGLIYGWVYHRHRNLIGVSMTHYFSGFAAFTFGVI